MRARETERRLSFPIRAVRCFHPSFSDRLRRGRSKPTSAAWSALCAQRRTPQRATSPQQRPQPRRRLAPRRWKRQELPRRSPRRCRRSARGSSERGPGSSSGSWASRRQTQRRAKLRLRTRQSRSGSCARASAPRRIPGFPGRAGRRPPWRSRTSSSGLRIQSGGCRGRTGRRLSCGGTRGAGGGGRRVGRTSLCFCPATVILICRPVASLTLWRMVIYTSSGAR